jgi:hypothetical protein
MNEIGGVRGGFAFALIGPSETGKLRFLVLALRENEPAGRLTTILALAVQVPAKQINLRLCAQEGTMFGKYPLFQVHYGPWAHWAQGRRQRRQQVCVVDLDTVMPGLVL